MEKIEDCRSWEKTSTKEAEIIPTGSLTLQKTWCYEDFSYWQELAGLPPIYKRTGWVSELFFHVFRKETFLASTIQCAIRTACDWRMSWKAQLSCKANVPLFFRVNLYFHAVPCMAREVRQYTVKVVWYKVNSTILAMAILHVQKAMTAAKHPLSFRYLWYVIYLYMGINHTVISFHVLSKSTSWMVSGKEHQNLW